MKHLIEFKLFEANENLTNDEIVNKASKYKNIVELKRKDYKLYSLVISNHLGNSAFPRKSKWTEEKIREEAKKYKTKSEFSRNSYGAYARAIGLNMLNKLYPNKKSN